MINPIKYDIVSDNPTDDIVQVSIDNATYTLAPHSFLVKDKDAFEMKINAEKTIHKNAHYFIYRHKYYSFDNNGYLIPTDEMKALIDDYNTKDRYDASYLPIKKSNVFVFSQQFLNGKTGMPFYTDADAYLSLLKTQLKEIRNVCWYSLIVHDSDTYSEKEELESRNKLIESFSKNYDSEIEELTNTAIQFQTMIDEENSKKKPSVRALKKLNKQLDEALQTLDKKKNISPKEYDNALNAHILDNQTIFAGNPKPRHFHLVIFFKNKNNSNNKSTRYISEICKRFQIPASAYCKKEYARQDNIDFFKHEAGYADHSDEKSVEAGKYLYDRDEIFTNMNLDELYADLAQEKADNEKYADCTCNTDKAIVDIEHGMTLDEVYQKYPIEYAYHASKFKTARSKYIQTLPFPDNRICLYVDAYKAKGGDGKSTICDRIAKMLAHEFYNAEIANKSINDLSKYIYFAGDSKVPFDAYDGQPIIILDDVKAGDVIAAFGNRKNIKNTLDPHGKQSAINVKYGQTFLKAKFFIINGITECSTFIKSLAKSKNVKDTNDVDEETSINQYLRRVQFYVHTYPTYNKLYYLNNNPSYSNDESMYISFAESTGDFSSIPKKFSMLARDELETDILQPLIDEVIKYDKAYEANSNTYLDEIPDEYRPIVKCNIRPNAQQEFEAEIMHEEELAKMSDSQKQQLQQRTESNKRTAFFKEVLSYCDIIVQLMKLQNQITFSDKKVTTDVADIPLPFCDATDNPQSFKDMVTQYLSNESKQIFLNYLLQYMHREIKYYDELNRRTNTLTYENKKNNEYNIMLQNLLNERMHCYYINYKTTHKSDEGFVIF